MKPVWLVMYYTEDPFDSSPSGGYIIAKNREEAMEILKKDLEMELSTSFHYQDKTQTLVGNYEGELHYYVESIICLNPEACGN